MMTTPLPILYHSNNLQLKSILEDMVTGKDPCITLLEAPSLDRPYILLETSGEAPPIRAIITTVIPERPAEVLHSLPLADRDQMQQILLFLARCVDLLGNWCYQEKIRKVRHDLRAPLNVILGFSGSLLQRGDRDPQDQSKIKAIQESGESLLTLINALYTNHTGNHVQGEKNLRSKIPELEPGQKDLVIMIVDDQVSNRQLLMDMLKPTGALLTQAATSAQALKTAEEVRPDLIFMDCYMPGGTGIQATGALKNLFRNHQAPPKIVGITAADAGEEKQGFLDAGAVEVLNKPIFEGLLAQCLVRLVDRKWKASPDTAQPEVLGPALPPGALPEQWRQDLISALDSGSISKLKQLSGEIHETHPELEKFLWERAVQYDLGSVKTWLEKWMANP